MKAIIENKIYDTKKCEEVYKFMEKAKYDKTLGIPRYGYRQAIIFKTKKGTYLKYLGKPAEPPFITILTEYKEELTIISEEEVKRILLNLNEVDIYIKLFGELEEG